MSDILITPNRGSSNAPTIQFSGSANASASIRLEVLPEGQVAFLGKSGSLFSISDNMVGSLMAVSDISGLPILEVFSDDKIVMGKYNTNTLIVTGSQIAIGKSGSNANTILDISGSVAITGSLRVTGSITGSLFGTSSYATTSLTSSYATTSLTSSYATTSLTSSYALSSAAAGISGGATNYIAKFSSATTLTSSLIVDDGANISVTGGITSSLDANIYGITVGRGKNGVSYNTAVGYRSLRNNTVDGWANVAVGYYSLDSNTTGYQNTATGARSLGNTTTGNQNVANGHYCMRGNTTGYKNVAAGVVSLRYNTTGYYNTADGYQSLGSNTSGYGNTGCGASALYSNTTGNNNTAVGYYSGYGNGANANITGTNNTFIGYGAMGASTSTSNAITLGDSNIATLRCQVTTITSLSDARDKSDIIDIPVGLNFIKQLHPVSFKWNMRDGGKIGISEFGFIAQELLEAQTIVATVVPNLVSTENPDKLEASAGTLIPILVKAIQELEARLSALEAK